MSESSGLRSDNIVADYALNKFIASHLCFPTPSRPNTTSRFQLVDTEKPPLVDSPCLFHGEAWARLLKNYPGPLPIYLVQIMNFGVQIGYCGPKILRLSKNLASAKEAPDIISQKILDDLQWKRVVKTEAKKPFISSPLGLVPKTNSGWRRIHHFSHPEGSSVNDGISREARELKYVTFQKY